MIMCLLCCVCGIISAFGAAGASWQHAVIEDNLYEVLNPSIAISRGNPVVAYTVRPSSKDRLIVKCAVWDGKAWNIKRIGDKDKDVYQPSVAADSNGIIHLAYFEGTVLKYAKFIDNVWHVQTVTADTFFGMPQYFNNPDTCYISLKLDVNNVPHIAFLYKYLFYYDKFGYTVRYASFNKETKLWDVSGDVCLRVNEYGRQHCSLALDRGGKAWIATEGDSEGGCIPYKNHILICNSSDTTLSPWDNNFSFGSDGSHIPCVVFDQDNNLNLFYSSGSALYYVKYDQKHKKWNTATKVEETGYSAISCQTTIIFSLQRQLKIPIEKLFFYFLR